MADFTHDAARRRFVRFLLGSPLLGLAGTLPLGRLVAQELEGRSGALVDAVEHAINVYDLEIVMKSRMNPGHWVYTAQGADDMGTIAANRAAFGKIQLRPQRLVDTRNVDLSVELFGERYAAPILLCPVGTLNMYDPEGEIAAGRAAKAKNVPQAISTFTNHSVEDVVSARGGPIWFQLYPPGNWAFARDMVQRAERAGCTALALTVDLPARNLEPMARFRRDEDPRCTGCHGPGTEALHRRPMVDVFDRAKMGGTGIAGLTWDYVKRLKDATSMKVLVKGIVTAEDAHRCLAQGADGIIVSNHGGRADETLRASIESLPEVVAAVGGRVPVIVDSGFRRGTDIFKALALGATAVGIGRPYLWGLGAFGQSGVERALDILTRELRIVMQQMGATNLAAISRNSLQMA
jgi:isopentenyl diphosphate isomerase/L-lactate dehydrogenase-like FMN-dependent dehydrogenase